MNTSLDSKFHQISLQYNHNDKIEGNVKESKIVCIGGR